MLRAWQDHDLQPHRTRSFKFSTDPELEQKVTDVIGLYLHPPEKAVVLCVDEKSQIQALDRTQPLLPMRPGQVERRIHDYVRHGTATLFAALDIATGEVTGRTYARHRHEEFLRFLQSVARRYPRGQLHLVLDNYRTHKHPEVQAWLAHHPRFHLHFTPTSSSWLNQVETWFSLVHRKAIHRGVFPQRGPPQGRHPALPRRLERPQAPLRLGEVRNRGSTLLQPRSYFRGSALAGATPSSRGHAPGDGRPSLSRRRPALTLPPARPRVTRRPHEEAICASRVEIGAPLQTEPGWFPVTLQIPAVIQLALPMISCAT